MPKYIEIPSDEPVPNGGKEIPVVKEDASGSHVAFSEGSKPPASSSPIPPQIITPSHKGDRSYIGATVDAIDETVNKPMTSGAKLLDKYGVGVFLMIVFTGILVASLYYARSDAIEKDTLTRDGHDKTVKSVVDTFSETVRNMREDHREERARQDIHQAKMYQGMRDIRDSNNAQASMLQKATEVMSINGDAMKKSNEAIEKTLQVLGENGKMIKALVENQKKQ